MNHENFLRKCSLYLYLVTHCHGRQGNRTSIQRSPDKSKSPVFFRPDVPWRTFLIHPGRGQSPRSASSVPGRSKIARSPDHPKRPILPELASQKDPDNEVSETITSCFQKSRKKSTPLRNDDSREQVPLLDENEPIVDNSIDSDCHEPVPGRERSRAPFPTPQPSAPIG